MKVGPFQAGDKVVLAHADRASMSTVPRLVPGRVYCISAVFLSEPTPLFPAHQRVHLCGVRLSRRMRRPHYGLPFSAFRRVGDQAKEEA